MLTVVFVTQRIFLCKLPSFRVTSQGSMAVKIFVAQFINTALVILLLSADVELLEFLPGQFLPLQVGQTDSLTLGVVYV